MKHHQRGAATLFVTVILLALLTVIVITVARIGMLELKTAANTNRAKEALHNAQGGLDYGAMMYLEDDTWASAAIQIPLSAGADVTTQAVVQPTYVEITATGESEDTTGAAKVRERYARIPLVDFGELPPLMSNGNFPPSGTFTIVTNPNGGGKGVPVSAWVDKSTTQGTASWQTCNVDEWLYEDDTKWDDSDVQSDGFVTCDTCSCSAAENKLCEATNGFDPSSCADIVEDPGVIDVFHNLFGVDPTTGEDINGKDVWEAYLDAVAVRADCADLTIGNIGDQFYGADGTATRLPLVYVDTPDATCSVAADGQVASYDKPIILVVHGDFKMNGGASLYGVVLVLSDIYGPHAPNDEAFKITVNGTPIVYGVIMVNADVDLPTGNFTLVYSQNILAKLSNVNDTFYELARFPGTWTDIE